MACFCSSIFSAALNSTQPLFNQAWLEMMLLLCCAIEVDFSSKEQRSMETSQTCSPPVANPCTQPCRATLSALPNSQEALRTLLSRNPRCKLWYTPHFSIIIFHCKEAETAIFIFFPLPLRCGVRKFTF